LETEHREALLAFAAAAYERRPLPAVSNWEPLLDRAQAHGLVPLAYRLLRDSDCPPEIARIFRAHAFGYALRSGQHEKASSEVLAAFGAAGIDNLVLKGPAVGRTVYADPSLRPTSDLDILIPEERWQAARDVLVGQGYIPEQPHDGPPPKVADEKAHYHSQYRRDRDRMLIEVHYDPWWYGLRPRLRELFWQRSAPLTIGGVLTRMLSAEDQLLHACIHLHHHSYTRLIWFTDLALLIQRPQGLDWTYFVWAARQEGLELLVYYSLYYLEQLLGVSAPASVMSALRPNPLQAWVHDHLWPAGLILGLEVEDRALCDFHEVPEAEELLFNFLLTGRRREKLAYIGHLLAPSADWLAYYYGVSDPATLRLRRLVHAPKLLAATLRELAQMFLNGPSRRSLTTMDKLPVRQGSPG
jgi:hypothetical protein